MKPFLLSLGAILFCAGICGAADAEPFRPFAIVAVILGAVLLSIGLEQK